MRQDQLYKHLTAKVEHVQGELKELQRLNGELQVRLAARQLAWRVLREARAHRLARSAACDQEDEQLRSLEELRDEALGAAGELGAVRGAGAGPGLLDAHPHLAPDVSVLHLEG